MTNYLTDPATAKAYGNAGIDGIVVDAWLAVSFDVPPDLDWSDHQYLSCGPRSLFLAFEQGKNTEPCVFALKSNPTRDLAGDSEFGLHYLADEPDSAEFPADLRAFYAPIAELIDRLAADTSRPRLDRAVEVMTALIGRIAELGIVRVQDFDEDGSLVGMDRDVASELPAAWRATVAKEMP